jgi:hypothetical protein
MIQKGGHSEHDLQKAIFQWAHLYGHRIKDLEFMFAVPNGGHRHKGTARRLKAEGVKPGVADICLPVPRGGFHGLWAECKVGKNQLTPEQRDFLFAMGVLGYKTTVWRSFEQAIDEIEKYLGGWIRKGGE